VKVQHEPAISYAYCLCMQCETDCNRTYKNIFLIQGHSHHKPSICKKQMKRHNLQHKGPVNFFL